MVYPMKPVYFFSTLDLNFTLLKFYTPRSCMECMCLNPSLIEHHISPRNFRVIDITIYSII